MQNPKGLKKGLLQQWQAASSPMEKFGFLKAFLLDRDLESIVVEAYYENENNEMFEELPLCEIRQRYSKIAGGEQFVKELVESQKGKKHPQTENPEWRIYKVFKAVQHNSPLVHLMTPNLMNCIDNPCPS
ncbi:Rrbp1 [Symbiodinium natans]|uniref:Rrbp1 protein n=1 Tax=Symbiodinium natans TaxID=878477 RepID=A0A812JGL6_9DINO|nr:Rrbp1 [Symbiodinium natans]